MAAAVSRLSALTFNLANQFTAEDAGDAEGNRFYVNGFTVALDPWQQVAPAANRAEGRHQPQPNYRSTSGSPPARAKAGSQGS